MRWKYDGRYGTMVPVPPEPRCEYGNCPKDATTPRHAPHWCYNHAPAWAKAGVGSPSRRPPPPKEKP